MHDYAIEAAMHVLRAEGGWQKAGSGTMRLCVAAFLRAEADNITHTGAYAPAIVESWLRGKADELEGREPWPTL